MHVLYLLLFPECTPGFYGAGCKLRCSCPPDVLCDPETGACKHPCPAGFHGEKCHLCRYSLHFPEGYTWDGKAYSGNSGSDIEVADKQVHLLLIRAGSSPLKPDWYLEPGKCCLSVFLSPCKGQGTRLRPVTQTNICPGNNSCFKASGTDFAGLCSSSFQTTSCSDTTANTDHFYQHSSVWNWWLWCLLMSSERS